MQVTEIDVSGLKREYVITVPKANVDLRLEQRLKEISKTLRLSGFRPGHVPVQLIHKRYGKSVRGEVLEAVINDSMNTALGDKGLRLALKPDVEILNQDEKNDLEFKVKAEILPEITPMEFKEVTLLHEKAEVKEKEIDEALERMAMRNGEQVKVSRSAQLKDVIEIDYEGMIDGVAFAGGKAENYKLTLGSQTFIPGFEEQLVDKKNGAKVKVKVTFPTTYSNEELAGKEAEFAVKIHQIYEIKPAVIDDEFAKKMGLELLEDLKAALRKEITRELDALAKMRLKRRLLDVMTKNHDFEVPDGMIKREFDEIWKQVLTEKQAGRLDPEEAAKGTEVLEAEYRELSIRRVRLALLLAEIGGLNNLTVDQEDVNRAIMAEARKYPGREEMIFDYYNNNPAALEVLRAPLFEDKIIDFILGLIKFDEVVIDADRLRLDLDDDEGTQAQKAVKSTKSSKKTVDKAAKASVKDVDRDADSKSEKDSDI